MTPRLIEFSAVTKEFKNHRALDSLSLQLLAGSTVGLLGPNGAGKTTCLSTMLGLLRPTSGSVSIFGGDLWLEGPKIRQQIGYVPEDPWLYPWMTVRQVIRFASSMYERWSSALADDLLVNLNLPPDCTVKNLSKGMRMKAALLVALAHRPRLLILDEPMSGLDPLAREDLVEILIELRGEETECIIISSHQIDDVTRLADEVVILHAGENRFPDVEYLYGDELMRAVRENLKIRRCAGWSPASGFGRLTKLQRSDPTFGYHGSGASLGDPNRVLVHWSTAEGRSLVLFCDLSHREVDGGELLNLLSPWQTVANQCVVRVGSGSGTIVSPKGLIVTAAHVLPSSGSSIDIHFADGRAMTSTVVAQSRRFDVAVLKIPVDQSIPFVRLEERHVREDQAAWILGYGGGRSEPAIRQVRTVQYVLDELITTWNNVIGGDCGGAVLNAKGCLIGVLDTLAEPHPRYCRTISSPTLLKVFPVLAEQLTEKSEPRP